MIKSRWISIFGAFLLCMSMTAGAEPKITVFAAASLTNAISEIAAAYENDKPVSIQTSFAASSTLAKQIEKGAPADIFISADTKWMDYLQDKRFIVTDSRADLLTNRLVLIAPKGKAFKVKINKGFNFANAFSGRLCTGETESVPVGIYARQSLQHLNWWDSIKTRLVGTQDVRAALVFVERGECEAGIVYETDAIISSKVDIVAHFPDNSHDPIIYPLALTKGASAQARDFYQYLQSEKAKTVFSKYGFNR